MYLEHYIQRTCIQCCPCYLFAYPVRPVPGAEQYGSYPAHTLVCVPLPTSRITSTGSIRFHFGLIWDWLALLRSTHRARRMALDFDASSLRARPAKRSRLEADRRRDMFQRVANKFADIDFTKYQYLHARTTDAAETAGSGRGRIVPVKPVPTALVENWRHLESYECDGRWQIPRA